eukprot:Rhum_TRINITY_DN26542_c0_g1::Rhum_TRINITY_DN26542_c0_g1_i1::g.183849::m.183849/K12946/SPCS1; signal peptidase complex subunit 1
MGGLISSDGVSLKSLRQLDYATQGILRVSGVVAFFAGFYAQSALLMLQAFLAGVALCCLVVCPSWGVWSKDKVSWVDSAVVDAWLEEEKAARQAAEGEAGAASEDSPPESPSASDASSPKSGDAKAGGGSGLRERTAAAKKKK